jgi:hypothetical protein
MPVICPTSQGCAPAANWHDGQISPSGGERKRRMSMIDLLHLPKNGALLALTTGFRSLYFRAFLPPGASWNHGDKGGEMDTMDKSSVIFSLILSKNPGKTGVGDKKTQKTPRKTV